MALRTPLSWLNDYVDPTLSPDELAERLTVAGLEVETVEKIGAEWDPETLMVGEVLKVAPHPDADRLCLVTVGYGANDPLTVVTGAPNLLHYRNDPMPDAPLKVPFARVGAVVIDGHAEDGRTMKLKPGKIRGVVSEGMVCSEMELGLSDAHEGIMILPSDAPTGQPLAEYLGDAVLEFDIKGSFAHLMCVFGIAREVAALTGKPLRREVMEMGMQGNPKITDSPSFLKLEITHPDLCPRYTAVLIEGIKVQPSPFWLQQRLMRAGMRPINAVVDATNYVMLELGQPLHAFDYHAIRPEKPGETPLIRVRPATAGEKMETLDDVQRTFDDKMLLITDGGGPVAIAGVMGGLESEITEGTTDVLLESANFEFLNTRRTGQLLKLRTEASDRFGKRLDPELCLAASLRCATLITELCGGAIRPEYGDLYPQKSQTTSIDLNPGFITRLLGLEIPRPEVVRILKALEFSVEDGKEGHLMVTPPSYRTDVSMPADLVEEVARIYGYDNMVGTLISDDMPPQRTNRMLDGTERIRDLLIGSGLDEIITYSMVSMADDHKLYPSESAAGITDGTDGTGSRDGTPPAESDYVGLQNPLSAEKGHLRRRLLGEGLNTARANLRFGKRVAVFEVGAVFHPAAGQTLPNEPRRLCAVLTGHRSPESWQDGQTPPLFDFYDIKGAVEALLNGLEITGVEWQRGEDPAYHPGRSAKLSLDGQVLGHLGELHPGVAADFGLDTMPVCAMELDVDALIAHWNQDRQMTPLSSHPPLYEDVAFIVAGGMPAEQVRQLILQTGKPMVRQAALFDLYEGEQVGAGNKSLAFALTFQADDRTLTDNEVAKVRGKIIKRLERELDAKLRG